MMEDVAVELLTTVEAARRQYQLLTYDGSGHTRTKPPPGYFGFTRTRRLPESTGFEEAAEALLTWQVQVRAGLSVAASTTRIGNDAVCVMTLGRAPVALTIPCRVVYTITEPTERGFAYGTLPGHPESGEEAFVLHRRSDGRVDFTITAFSRPATVLAKLGGPITRQIQRAMTTRYLHTLDR